jgi:tetratricopeptide (TPR) repeat protein
VRRVIAVGGALAVALAAVSVLLVEEERSPLASDLIVVDVFANQTGDPALDPLGAMAGHWLVQGLQGSGLRVVPFDASLASLSRDTLAGAPGPGRLETLARAAGARIVVSGSYYREGDELILQAEISDAEKGEVLFGPSAVHAPLGSPSLAFPPLRDGVREFLYRYLNPAVVLDTLPGWVQPPDFEAYRRFVVGMEYFVDTDWAAASPYFEEAAGLDPTYPPFLYMSAIALGNQGRSRDAQAYLTKLDALDERMTPYDRATVDWLKAERPVDKLRAARRMTDVGPSYVGFFLVAWHTLELNRPAEALEILAQPGVGDMLAVDWSPYWDLRVQALHSLERHEEELDVARQGLARHPDVPVVVGLDLPALAALGRSGEVLEECDRLLNMGTAGIQPLITLGDELHAHGEPAAAAGVWVRVAERLTAKLEDGVADPTSPPYLALIEVLERLERNAEARSLVSALATRDSVSYMEHAGLLAARLGKVEEASAVLSWLAERQEGGARGHLLHARARIAAELGDAEHALGLLPQAVAESGAYWALHRDYGLRALRDDPRFQELVRPDG